MAQFVHASFTGVFVFFGIHSEVVLGIAAGPVGLVEHAVSTVQNVHLWVCELRVAERVNLPVLVPDKLCPGRMLDTVN